MRKNVRGHEFIEFFLPQMGGGRLAQVLRGNSMLCVLSSVDIYEWLGPLED